MPSALTENVLSEAQEVREHRQTFDAFSKLVLFAGMHIALVLACLALAFVGGLHIIALLLGVLGTIGLIVGFFVTA